MIFFNQETCGTICIGLRHRKFLIENVRWLWMCTPFHLKWKKENTVFDTVRIGTVEWKRDRIKALDNKDRVALIFALIAWWTLILQQSRKTFRYLSPYSSPADSSSKDPLASQVYYKVGRHNRTQGEQYTSKICKTIAFSNKNRSNGWCRDSYKCDNNGGQLLTLWWKVMIS